ncbi:Thioesterase/thiol ester dehydrase-isomerase [Suhomyces tanzawaensis NRRL Y-17324]|uniref:Thioesterase/thiol ester dehydrase-isomerase n=1 Tax=Suhomyces tanzawaensis NRRL Y-17324 TaxID=984487 RepID=A0A1E4SAX8_9ASCO|nr:Thioesterase/thiol ester dehydrase-isomerase [Suhomyces tanzawaensis NRRL Y-17324]ODV76625.1 Thioesterase/thiol ester dehydrase-isomerase [Suhomyces tanzawaensis NRRL Y-17324]
MAGPIDVEQLLGVNKLADGSYVGRLPMIKAHPQARGAYGGNIAGQALVAVAADTPPGFVPHSFQSYFIGAVDDKTPLEWKIEQISQGKSFCNRHVRGYQDGQLKFYGNASLTRKNSHDEQPFQFQTPYHQWLASNKLDAIPTDNRGQHLHIYHKMPPQFSDLASTRSEESRDVTDRRLAWFVRWGNDEDPSQQLVEKVAGPYKYAGLVALSDSLFLTRLARNLRLPVDHLDPIHYFSVSLDHVIYFHDDNFDATQWLGFSFRALRLVNKRVVLEAEIYDVNGVHVATVIQEGLIHLNGLEETAKL